MTDSLAGLTEEVSEDDYEEGEILDGDSLYDDVSSSEEFTESEIERKKSNENEEAQGRKRKEHICKDGSLCRKERSGKHCYARIKHRRTSLESTEKPRNFDDKKVKERNISKTWKKHDILKDKDILKTFQTKERRRQERGYDRRQENKAKYRSPSPKFHHVHSAKPTKTSLLKRLVASGSVSARVPTESEMDKNEKDLDMKPIGEDHNEWNLRIEALKTALMKKFASKKKNCATLKTNSLNDSIFEYALNDLADHGDNKPKDVDYRKPCLEIESFNESIFKERKTILFSDTDVDCRTFTCYPYVFDKILSPKEDVAVVPNGERPKSPEKIENSLKRKNSLNILDAKKPKFEAEDKDEEELRELALMSVKPKSKNEPLNPKDELLKPLHIDTQLPSEPEKMTSNNSGSDPWEDVDEDILRAQLLSSLSAKIHSEYVEPEPTPKKPVKKLVKIKKPVKKIIKTNPSILLKDKFVNKRFVKKNNQITGPTMKKLIIKVDDSDSSDVETPVKMKPDISASIDQLLKEVRSETEKLLKEKNPVIPNLNDPTNLSKNSSETTPKITANNKILNIDTEKMSSKSSSKSIATPQGIKHLPPWQQEEYRILKKKLFEKQKMWNLKAPMKSPVDENGKTENSNLQPKETSKPPILPKAEEVLKERSEQKQVQIESWHESKEVSEMLILLEKLEKELDEFRCVKDETARLRKEYSLMQNKMLKKKRLLILSKEALENKDDLLKSKYSEFLKKKTEEQKQSHRDSEMSTLRFKEISLRAQLVCINLEKELKIEKMSKKEKSTPSSPLKKPKIPPDVKSEEGSRENQKKVFSLADKDNLDPFMPLCPYDITGVCNDEECKYQHIRPL